MTSLPVQLLAALLGSAYALALWGVARCVARRRHLHLGPAPYATVGACGIAAACVATAYPPPVVPILIASFAGAAVCAVVDARTGLIFDALTITMGGVGAMFASLAGDLGDALFAAAVVGGALAALHLITGRRGIGLGDVKLGAALALGFGLQLGIVAVGSAFVIGAGYAVTLLAMSRAHRTDAVRFGPFIAGGAAAGLTLRSLGFPW